jgi:hypothetical protein
MKIIRIALLVAALPIAAPAQDAEQKAVIAVVEKLFDGMRKADTAMMRLLFAGPGVRMMGINREGQFNPQPVDGWLTGIGRKPAEQIWDEKTWAHEAKVDGNIAQVWMQYAFYIGERLNHCGVNAIDFMKFGTEWKIVSIMDSRRNTGCTPPPKQP